MLNFVKVFAAGFVSVASAGPREYIEDDLILNNRADKVAAVEQVEKVIDISHYLSYKVMHKFAVNSQEWSERS